jgi:hypothetical protein
MIFSERNEIDSVANFPICQEMNGTSLSGRIEMTRAKNSEREFAGVARTFWSYVTCRFDILNFLSNCFTFDEKLWLAC